MGGWELSVRQEGWKAGGGKGGWMCGWVYGSGNLWDGQKKLLARGFWGSVKRFSIWFVSAARMFQEGR